MTTKELLNKMLGIIVSLISISTCVGLMFSDTKWVTLAGAALFGVTITNVFYAALLLWAQVKFKDEMDEKI